MKRMTTNPSSPWISPEEPLTLRTSLVKTYLRCPAQCLFRYFKGLVVLPRSVITMGICTHEAAEHANKYKRDKGKEEKVSVLQDVFHESWKDKSKHTEFDPDEDPNELEGEGVKKIIPTYHEKIYKKVEPLHVEERFEIQIDPYLTVTGAIDLVETDHMIRDLKTKGRAPAWDEPAKSFQGKSYLSGYFSKFKKEPEGFVLDCLIRKKEPEVISTRPVPYSTGGHKEFMATCQMVAQSIRWGHFFPKREGNFFCNKKHCGYWDICKKGQWANLTPYTKVFNANSRKGKVS